MWPVPKEWDTDEKLTMWDIPNVDSFEGPNGGPQYGVSNDMQEITRTSSDISSIFFPHFLRLKPHKVFLCILNR